MHARYNKDHAIQDMQVGHSHGLLVEAAEGLEKEDMELLMCVECGMVEEDDDDEQNHMEKGVEHTQPVPLVAARVADNTAFAVDRIFGLGVPAKGRCC